MRAAFAAFALVLTACGGSSGPPPIGDTFGAGGSQPSDAGGPADAEASDSAEPDAPNPIPWQWVASLPGARLPWVAVWQGDVWAQAGEGMLRVRTQDWTVDTVALTGSPGPYSHDEGAFCVYGTIAYWLGGGGNGIFGDWNVNAWDAVDLANASWLPSSGAPAIRHNLASVSTPTGCSMIGGDASQHGEMGTTTVWVNDAKQGTWGLLAPIPMPVSSPAAAIDGATLLVAGGRCYLGECSEATTSQPIAVLAHAWLVDATDPLAAWTALPDLPHAVHGASAVAHKGRFYVLGGYEQDQPPYSSHRAVVSWASGEGQFREDGYLPAGASTCVALSDGAWVMVAVPAQAGVDLWAWAP